MLRRLMAVLKTPQRDPELDKTRARINAAAAELARRIGVPPSEIIVSSAVKADQAIKDFRS